MKTPLLSLLRQAYALSQAGYHLPGRNLEELDALRSSRRQFLKTSASAGALLAVGGTGCVTSAASKASQEKIGIVGAGLSGLTAANYLRASGIKATLFEADKRNGGRLKSMKVFKNGQLNTEYGAEFIDTGHKAMFDLLKITGLENNLMDVDTDRFGIKDACFIEGKHRTVAEIIAELNPVYPTIAADQERLENPAGTIELDRLSAAEYIDRLPVSQWVKTLMHVAFLGENGLETSKQSALNFIGMIGAKRDKFEIFGDSDERFKVIGGNQQITTRLAENINHQIRYEHKLVRIAEQANGAIKLTFNGPGGSVEETFDAAIITVPFSVLREVDIQMELPTEKRRAIQELSYGTNTKFVLETISRPWRDQGYRGFLFSEKIPNGWDSSQMQMNNRGAGTYTVYFGGQRGVEAKKGTEAEQLAFVLPTLEAAFKGTESALTGKNELVNWPSNPFVKGSYSCYTVGQNTAFGAHTGTPVRNLYFAGEHCSVDHWGFMNGAAETGQLVAKAIIKRVKR